MNKYTVRFFMNCAMRCLMPKTLIKSQKSHAAVTPVVHESTNQSVNELNLQKPILFLPLKIPRKTEIIVMHIC